MEEKTGAKFMAYCLNYCGSCGMPMGYTDEMYGTEKDGNKSHDYCSYCYEDGKFTNDFTLEEMIAFCAPHMVQANAQMNEEDAISMMSEWFPQFKRWKQN